MNLLASLLRTFGIGRKKTRVFYVCVANLSPPKAKEYLDQVRETTSPSSIYYENFFIATTGESRVEVY